MTYIAINKDWIESKIKELEENLEKWTKYTKYGDYALLAQENANILQTSIELKIYKELLKQSIEVPVKKSWDEVPLVHSLIISPARLVKDSYPNGVIIKPE